ncbi:YncE family protein [Bacillus sp. SCS-151]|uniref:YncE family protein n=1 Tax=Nanhaiella sioensis TaxID=3115293 RepID=UPI00397E58FA
MGSVFVIYIKTHSIIASILVGQSPSSVSFTPNGKIAYVTNLNNSVTIIDVPTHFVIVDGSTSVIDTKAHSVIANVQVGTAPLNNANTPDGKLVFVTNSGNNSVSVIDTKTHSVIATIQVDLPPGFVVFTPDGKLAYVTASPPF